MADVLTIQRVADKLKALSESTPTGEGYWEALAKAVTDEATKTLTVTLGVIPAQPFLGLVPERGGVRLVARGATATDLMKQAEDLLMVAGSGEVWAAEIKRVWTVT